ncbi:MAG: glycosyltransferase family 1 protein [Hyphomicrobiaceae bacterium]
MPAASDGWTGGINYYANLFHAISTNPGRQISPVAFVPTTAEPAIVAKFAGAAIVRTPVLDSKSSRSVLGRIFAGQREREQMLRSSEIAVLSHVGSLRQKSSIPTISWIPDFQHVHCPQFFSAKELADRNDSYAGSIKWASLVLLSSQVAKHHLVQFSPEASAKARVLPFVSGLIADVAPVSEAALRAKYKIEGPYFHLPNQFWAHKNHGVVIEALALAKTRGERPLIICTGNTRDHRAPDYFDQLSHKIQRLGVADNFQILGQVPFEDLATLMIHAVAVINPSLFEGWSTTVEESKSLGKRLVLSDIGVHREQSPERADFFDPQSASSLSELLERALFEHDPLIEAQHCEQARAQLPSRFKAFADAYEAIALEAARQS